jgi:hypothetical protein
MGGGAHVSRLVAANDGTIYFRRVFQRRSK